jgi:acyl dehydratase
MVMPGLYFEDFVVGHVFEHAMSRTVTEMDNVLFSTLTMNPQPLHLDEEFAKTTEFGQRLVNSLFTLGLLIGMTVGETTLGTTIANLGMDKVMFPKPVFHGDTIRARSIVRSVRASKSRPEAGVVELEHQAINQRGELVATCLRSAFMKRRPA